MSIEENKALIRRYYHEIWNQWNLDLADDLVSTNFAFRGSLGVTVRGIDGFQQYVRMVRIAFPNFHNAVEDLIAEGDKVGARLTYRGTHQGELFGIAATGKQVTYSGMAIFRIEAGKIAEGWVIGDTLALSQQLGAVPAAGETPW